MSAAHRYSDQAGVLILGNGLSRAVRFLGGFLLPYVLLQEDYGVYQQVWVVYNLVEQCLRMGFAESVVYFFPRYQGRERAGMVWTVAACLGLLGLVFAAALFLGAPLIAKGFHTQRLATDLRLFAAYALLGFPTLYLNSLLLSAGRARTVAGLAVLMTAVESAAVIIPALAGLGLDAILGALVATAALQFLIAAGLTFRIVGLGWPRPGTLKELLAFAMPLGIPKPISIVGEQMDRLIMAAYLPAAAFAVYGRGATRIPFIQVVSSSALSVVQVGLAERWKRGDVAGFLDLWHESIRKVALLVLPLFFFMVAFGVPFYRWVFPPAYAEGAWVFWLYLWLLPLQLTATSHVLLLLGRPGLFTIFSVIAVGPAVLTTWACVHFLLPALGIIAPALAVVLVNWACFFAMLRIVGRRLGVGWSRVFPWVSLASIAGWGASAAGLGFAVHALLSGLGLPLAGLPGPAAFTAVILAGFFPGGLLGEGDLELVLRWLRLGRQGAATAVRTPESGERLAA